MEDSGTEKEKIESEKSDLTERMTKLRTENEKLDSEKSDLVKKVAKLQGDLEKLKNESVKKDRLIESYNKIEERVSLMSEQNDRLREKSQSLTNESSMEPFRGLKLVHFDLKGAPPKYDYLLEIIKYSKSLGADGLLIEYEDMFPWSGELKLLASPNAYSKEQIEEMLKLAESLKMKVIPLIQTFGHLEFVLKHKEFAKFRADTEIATSVCPINNGSVPLIKTLIDQVVEMHPQLEWIHLGGDEVWNLETCKKCVESNMTKSKLYMHHMEPLLMYVLALNSKKLKAIIWDDMLRDWKPDVLREMSEYVSPMVWAYVDDLSSYSKFPEDMWERYSYSFKEIWLASSFKGALKPWSNFVPIQQHLNNHLSWLKITSMLQSKGTGVKGIALTGWSRFDHYGPLCEVLPAGIPSLALCLKVLTEGKFNDEIHKNVSTLLGFKEPFKTKIIFKYYDPENATYPGSEVYGLVGTVEKALSGWRDWTSVREKGWIRDKQIQNNFISYFQINQTLVGYGRSLDILNGIKENAAKVLEKYFFEDMVNEWVFEKIDHATMQLKEKIEKITEIMKKKEFA